MLDIVSRLSLTIATELILKSLLLQEIAVKNTKDYSELQKIINGIPEMSLWDVISVLHEHWKPRPTFRCMIINAKSGSCPHDCRFCAQSAHWNTGAPVYPLLPKERIVEAGLKAEDAGIERYSVVTSGASPDARELDTICEAVSELKARTSLKVDASLGSLNENQARQLKQAGLDRYHHNLETSRSMYPEIATTQEYDQRIATLITARQAGLEICTGGIFGLGETWEQRVEMFNEIRELDPESVPVNFLVPVYGTPLGNRTPLHPLEALKIVSLARMILDRADVIIAGGRPQLGHFQSWLVTAGATGIMVGDYLTTRGEDLEADRSNIRLMEGIHGIQ